MILTEEQRAALKRVVAYMDEMYAIASPYHGCTEDANILRAMIDSSGTVEPVGGFDLERARGLRDFLQDDCAEVGDVWAEMIAEIERLREALDESERVVAHKTKSAAHWYDEHLQARADRVQTRRVVEQQAARIKALKADLEQSERVIEARLDVIDQQAARIKELEADNQNLVTLNKSLMNNDWILRDNNRKYRKRAQKAELLNKELKSKIGPDARPKCDHAWQAAIEERGYQTCLKCGECRNIEDIPRTAPAWQITEERKAAIKELSELLTAIGCPSCHYYIQKNYGEDITVLRAMLTEAE